jgi:hypothetical protein
MDEFSFSVSLFFEGNIRGIVEWRGFYALAPAGKHSFLLFLFFELQS